MDLTRRELERMVQGALAVSTVTTLDREHLQALYTAIRREIEARRAARTA